MRTFVARGSLAAMALAGGIFSAARAQEQDWNKVVEGAKKEGSVTVYHAQLGAPHWKSVVADFEKRYGVKVQEFDARASELTERIRVEQTSNRYVADIEFHGETSIVQQRGENYIAEHGGVPNAKNLREPFKADKWQTPAWVQPVCMLVNTNLVKPSDEPKVWADILDPKWKGKILTDDMRAVGSGQTVFAVLYKKYGEDFLARLQAQNMTIGRDLQENTRRVPRGEFPLFINQIIAFASAIKGLPARVVVPEDGCPYTPIQGAILRGAPHPNAARLFMNHLVEPESQVTYAKAWMGIVTAGVAEKLTDPDEKRFAAAKLMGSIHIDDRDAMLKRATEMMK